ncbi:MAG: hypothetical protein M3340_11690 [Actinomycetota bacterium]|nr:hypothetical protein [Actinomycetota bacterium]
MRIRRPSPAMVVAIVALVMACAGTSIAAVNYASNAGAVDGLSAVRAGSVDKAAGRLIAAARTGIRKGTIPNYHLSGVPHSDTFGNLFQVPDNQAGGQVVLDESELGRLSASCSDENNTAGNENPTGSITFTNTNATPVNFARHVGNGQAASGVLQNNAAFSFAIGGANTFRVHTELFGVNVVYEGFVRQVNQGTAEAQCLIVGTVQRMRPEK